MSKEPLAPAERLRSLQRLGVLCGITAGAWLGAAEVPAKLVSTGLSPILISWVMVLGVFLARWSFPLAIRGTRGIGDDLGRAPHLVIWAVIAGCLWSVANTLTIFAIRDLGLSIAFPLWNSNALIGIVWGVVFFEELRDAGWLRWLSVSGGALLMFCGGLLLARVSVSQVSHTAAIRGIAAALGAALLWGTMYIPYRKAYLSGMNPMSFITFFTVGELGIMTLLAARYLGGLAMLRHELREARPLLFWLLAAGFVWVIGDIFQQYAVKYVGVSRGIPLSNSNQLWGLAWGAVAFGEFRGWSHAAVANVIYGCLLMTAGMTAISFSGANESEYDRWRKASKREQERYGIDAGFVQSGLEGRGTTQTRSWLDWALIVVASGVFLWMAFSARWPSMEMNRPSVVVLAILALILFAGGAFSLAKATKFN